MDPLKVLVVDDELGIRLGVARILRGLRMQLPEIDGDVSFAVDQAGTGTEAIEKIKAAPPDILLLDYKLPDLTGLEILDRLTAESVPTLTIMITAYASIETAVSATKRGAWDFVAKPFTPEELRTSLRKAAQRLLLERQARALQAERRRVRFQFISVLAHELKSPLNAIEGYLNILKDRTAGDDPATYDRMLGRSLDRIDSMRKLIQDLLDMTRIESGQRQRKLEEVDACEVARTAIEGVEPAAAERSITVELHARASAPMTADRGELEIVFNNLLTNAVKYNREGGRVDVTLATEGEELLITVADTGIGMTEEEIGRLFNDFTRIRNEKTKQIPGSGLGLSILKKLVTLYEGSVAVTSQSDKGSTFAVRLKLHAATPSEPPAPQP